MKYLNISIVRIGNRNSIIIFEQIYIAFFFLHWSGDAWRKLKKKTEQLTDDLF